ncbi:MAG: DNA repair protein RecN [Candidatus Rokubacteria bacterium]|nr:DNA repair protein RecN [Candidatus Rokubacteria bacterium]
MLRELRVRNVAVIDAIEVEFEPGLNVLTGETGAGKSVLIDAILLVRGARAQTDLIRSDVEVATVEAVFEIDRRASALAVLDDAGLGRPDDLRIVIRREIARSGRHRAFVNDSAVTVGLLERLGDHLVEVHGQHEHQRLLEPGHQLDLLDRFADAEAQRERVATLAAKYRTARDALDRTRAAERDRAQREDLLRFQVSEIDAARLSAGEEETLRAELRRLRNAEKFTGGLADVQGLLADGPQAASAALGRAVQVLRALGRLDPAFETPIEALDAAAVQLDEALAALRQLRDGLVFEPGRLAEIDERLDAITRLERKYGETEDAILAFRADAAIELDRLARHEEVLAEQERLVADLRAELSAEAAALSERRQAAAERLGAQTQRELRALGMERARFDVAVEPDPGGQVTARGLDRVEFRLSTNPGEDLRPLARVASGGELSRAALALLTVLAAADPVATMIFDEVDAGIGARVAGVVADKLAALAGRRQVFCVTHLAPIAARAKHHLRVTKAVRAGRTRTAASPLTGDDRVREIARMLAGDAESASALGHARELLRGKTR